MNACITIAFDVRDKHPGLDVTYWEEMSRLLRTKREPVILWKEMILNHARHALRYQDGAHSQCAYKRTLFVSSAYFLVCHSTFCEAHGHASVICRSTWYARPCRRWRTPWTSGNRRPTRWESACCCWAALLLDIHSFVEVDLRDQKHVQACMHMVHLWTCHCHVSWWKWRSCTCFSAVLAHLQKIARSQSAFSEWTCATLRMIFM